MKRTKIFGTDGVRGKANHFPMTPEIALALGRAMGKVMRKRKGKHRIIIGKDTRLSCYVFENAIIAGLCSMGVDTFMVGPLPTPGVAFITRAYRADAGVVISASHNIFTDNGFKFFSSEGYKLTDELEKEIERLIETKDFINDIPEDHLLGKNCKIDDAVGRYVEYVKATFPKNLSLKGIKIALDTANGAAYRVAPLVCQELDAEVVVTANNPNGLNINELCGAMDVNAIRKKTVEIGAHIGIAFDGDADRVIMIDEKGNVVEGDMILAICAQDLFEKKRLANDRVVTTIMTNFGIMKGLQDRGIEVHSCNVGDRYVIRKMLEVGSNLGGEQSGHIIFLDYNTTGDGLISALQILRIMIEKKVKLSELVDQFKKIPQISFNVPIKEKPSLDTLDEVQKSITNAQKQLKDRGRVLVRYSGTEDICRIMAEGPNASEVKALVKDIAENVKKQIGKS